MATSSSDLKEQNTNSNNEENNNKSPNKLTQSRNVVSRLSKAAKAAAAAREQQQEEALEDDDDDDNGPGLGFITDLNKVLDEELKNPQQRSRLPEKVRPPREYTSMMNLLEHNNEQAQKQQAFRKKNKLPQETSTCHVAVVFSKPLVDDQVTIEYAARLISLARGMKDDSYTPVLICLLNNQLPTDGNTISDATAGYVYFRHLCASHDISLDETPISIVPTSPNRGGSLHPVAQAIQHGFLDNWLDQSGIYESKTDEYGLNRSVIRKKVHIHITLVSSDYHLCNLNDIYQRSPQQSQLHTLQEFLETSSSRGIVDTTWSFRYATYPFVYAKDEATAFLGKSFLLSQQLLPLLVNLRGVVNNVRTHVTYITHYC
jgi:hypothetical protein